jgi:hypothetical protein
MLAQISINEICCRGPPTDDPDSGLTRFVDKHFTRAVALSWATVLREMPLERPKHFLRLRITCSGAKSIYCRDFGAVACAFSAF